MPRQLEVVLDHIQNDFPATFSEFLLGNARQGLPTDLCTTDTNGWCWVVAQNTLHLWNLNSSSSIRRNSHFSLTLVPNSRPYSAKDIVVYETDSEELPGVMAVSANGTVRHWRSLNAQFCDTHLNLSNETFLSLAILEPGEAHKSARVMLTTSLGSIYDLIDDGTDPYGKVYSSLIASYTTGTAFTSRLSNMFSRVFDIKDKRATRSLAIRRQNQPMNDFVVIGPGHITVFDPTVSLQPTFSVSADDICAGPFGDWLLKRSDISVSSYTFYIVDAVQFRHGIFILVAAISSTMPRAQFACAFYESAQSLQNKPVWFCNVPLAQPESFLSSNENTFLGQLSLCIPRDTCYTKTLSWDGITILHKRFVQMIHIPEDLKWGVLPLNRSKQFEGDQLIGYGCNAHNVIGFFAKEGLFTFRLLPLSYPSLFSNAEKNFGNIVEVAKSYTNHAENMFFYNNNLRVVLHSYYLYCQKDLKMAYKTLEQISASDLVNGLHRFAEEIAADSNGILTKHISDFRQKLEYRVILARRLNFMVTSMKFDAQIRRVQCVQLAHSTLTASKSNGLAVVNELVERMAALDTLYKWISADSERTELAKYIIKNSEAFQKYVDKPLSAFFAKASHVKLFVPQIVITAKNMPQQKRLLTQDYLSLLILIANTTNIITVAIDKERRAVAAPDDKSSAETWTNGLFSDSILELCYLIVKYIDDDFPISGAQRQIVIDLVKRLTFFSLNEASERPDGCEVLALLYNINEGQIVKELAERFKDFKILVKMALLSSERDRILADYKVRFKADKFEEYLCKYYRQKGMNNELLGERSNAADAIIESCEDLRWRKNIMADKFMDASTDLLNIGDRAQNPEQKEQAYLFAKLSALCAENSSLTNAAEQKWSLYRPADI